ncbi:MAG: hypothetical protein VX949_08290, partial [Planctomycetota bacterium]|nr:hypothetical protein [Planctomycetota bacterium]
TMQVIHSDGTVLFGGDGQGNGPDGVLGVALDIGSAPFDLFHFAAGPGSTSWLAGGERMVRMQPSGNVVVDVDFGPGYPVQDIAAGPNGSVFVLFNTCVYRIVPDGSLAAYVELPLATAPTKLAVTTIQGGDERIDRVAVLNPSSNQVFQYNWQHDDEVLAAETLTHNRGGNSICWGPDRQLWIAGQEAGTSDATLTAYNSDGTPTGIDLTFPGQTILLTENSAAMPAVAAFPDDDFDGDDYSNINEQVAGSNPFDSDDDPTDEVPDYTPPVDSLSSVIIGDNHFAFLEWTWSSPTADFPQFYEITRTTDGVLAAGFPVQVDGTATSWTDENGGDGLPDGVHEYSIIVIIQGGSNCVTSVLVVGGGETESETPIDVPGSEEGELTEIYDITADPDALPGGIKYYATDSLNGKIYGLDENFVVVVVIPSPFADGEPVTGIAFIKEGFGGIKTLVVGKGSSGGQMHLMEIDLIGNYIRDYFLYNPLPAVPNGQKFLPGAIAGKSGGMGYDESSSTMYITGPDTCEIFGMLQGGDGAINPEQSFPHPNEGAQQKGCTTGNCSGSPWVGCTAPIFITSQTADGTLEIIEVSVSGGVATQVGEGISLAAIDDPGGILFDGENFVITGNSDGTVYEVQATGNFTRGDPNEDGVVDIGDPIYELGYLFVNGPAPECIARLDANDDNLVDIADTIFLLTFLFNNGPQPPEPFDVAGPDPTPSSVTPCP